MTADGDVCRLVSSVDHNGTQRITFLDADAVVFCGAYKLPGHTHWRLYLGAALAGDVSPRSVWPAQHMLTSRRADACRWLELIAQLYAQRANTQAPQHISPVVDPISRTPGNYR